MQDPFHDFFFLFTDFMHFNDKKTGDTNESAVCLIFANNKGLPTYKKLSQN